jgi:methionyl-tRNA formyltransferase
MKIVFLGANGFSAESLNSLLKHAKTALQVEILTNHPQSKHSNHHLLS